MKRRSFVKSTLMGAVTATVLPAVSNANAMHTEVPIEEYYELRVYSLKDASQQNLVEDYLQNALIPALNRHTIKRAGVFTELKPQGQTKVFVLIPYVSPSQIDRVQKLISGDKGYIAKAAAYLNAPSTSPAYERIESSLLKAFPDTALTAAPERKPRIFELRQYQSASEAAGKKKIEMFTGQGEIDIFKRLGFNPVFWGETVIGPLRPNLTYMITFDDLAAKDAHWKAFGSDPQWKKISSVPEYADALLVSKITSTMLSPTAYSQI
jgi:NIPSNAP